MACTQPFPRSPTRPCNPCPPGQEFACSRTTAAAALLTKGDNHPEGQHSTLPEVGHYLGLRGWHCQVSWVQHLALQHEPHQGDAGHPGGQRGRQASTVHVQIEAWGRAEQGKAGAQEHGGELSSTASIGPAAWPCVLQANLSCVHTHCCPSH